MLLAKVTQYGAEVRIILSNDSVCHVAMCFPPDPSEKNYL